MTKHDEAALRRYLRTVRGMLPCDRKQKRHILKELQCSVDAFLAEHPDADLPQLQAHFGTPDQIAASYVDDLDTPALLRAMHARKRVITVAVATALAILLSWACVVTWAVIDHNNESNGYFTTTIT